MKVKGISRNAGDRAARWIYIIETAKNLACAERPWYPMRRGKITDRIQKDANAFFRGGRGSHGWDHTERVLKLALRIGRTEDADAFILTLAALLHDIGRAREDESLGAVCHAKEGARMARGILEKRGLDQETIESVVHAIEHHRFRGRSRPDTVEARVLFDADKLDAIGAVGIGRAFLFAGEQGARLHNDRGVDPLKKRAYGREDTAYREFLAKLKHVHKRMLTREGRRLAKGRHDFMVKYFDRLAAEVSGRK